MERDIFWAICGKGGAVLHDDLADMKLAPLNHLDNVLMKNRHMFNILRVDGKCVVLATSNVKLCKIRNCNGCHQLHICKQYLLGECSGDECTSSHDLESPHNVIVLKKHGLRGLDKGVISTLLFQNYILPNSQTTQGDTGKDEMCSMYIIGRCTKRDGRCEKAHSSMPYLWQWYDGNEWVALRNNEKIEKDYCDPAKTRSDRDPGVDFETMTCREAKVRRLSITHATFHTMVSLITRWIWYLEDQKGVWEQYGNPTDQHLSSVITSEELEVRYQKNETIFTFTAGKHQYQINFLKMTQKDLHSNTRKRVRRRPVFISTVNVLKACEKYEGTPPSSRRSLPDHWHISLVPSTGYERMMLEPSSKEYRDVLRRFSRTMVGWEILSIERIQNEGLWRLWKVQWEVMKKKARKDVCVKKLFHGTKSKSIDPICSENLDWRLCGKNGTKYGEGCYFARDADYSNEYTQEHGTKCMFLCLVLVGDYTKGHCQYTKPPFKDGEETITFDSCVDNADKPSLFVIFDKNQIYPEYLIQYIDLTQFNQSPAKQTQTTSKSTIQMQTSKNSIKLSTDVVTRYPQNSDRTTSLTRTNSSSSIQTQASYAPRYPPISETPTSLTRTNSSSSIQTQVFDAPRYPPVSETPTSMTRTNSSSSIQTQTPYRPKQMRASRKGRSSSHRQTSSSFNHGPRYTQTSGQPSRPRQIRRSSSIQTQVSGVPRHLRSNERPSSSRLTSLSFRTPPPPGTRRSTIQKQVSKRHEQTSGQPSRPRQSRHSSSIQTQESGVPRHLRSNETPTSLTRTNSSLSIQTQTSYAPRYPPIIETPTSLTRTNSSSSIQTQVSYALRYPPISETPTSMTRTNSSLSIQTQASYAPRYPPIIDTPTSLTRTNSSSSIQTQVSYAPRYPPISETPTSMTRTNSRSSIQTQVPYQPRQMRASRNGQTRSNRQTSSSFNHGPRYTQTSGQPSRSRQIRRSSSIQTQVSHVPRYLRSNEAPPRTRRSTIRRQVLQRHEQRRGSSDRYEPNRTPQIRNGLVRDPEIRNEPVRDSHIRHQLAINHQTPQSNPPNVCCVCCDYDCYGCDCTGCTCCRNFCEYIGSFNCLSTTCRWFRRCLCYCLPVVGIIILFCFFI